MVLCTVEGGASEYEGGAGFFRQVKNQRNKVAVVLKEKREGCFGPDNHLRFERKGGLGKPFVGQYCLGLKPGVPFQRLVDISLYDGGIDLFRFIVFKGNVRQPVISIGEGSRHQDDRQGNFPAQDSSSRVLGSGT